MNHFFLSVIFSVNFSARTCVALMSSLLSLPGKLMMRALSIAAALRLIIMRHSVRMLPIIIMLLALMAACAPVEPEHIVIPPHFLRLGSELAVSESEVSGPLALYRVRWRGEELLPLGYSLWSGRVDARNGPGVSLLIRLYPDGELPRDLNCEKIISTLEKLEERWLITVMWLENALLSGDLDILRSYLPKPEIHLVDFSGDSWISVDPLDEKIYSGIVRLKVYPGERRRYIGLNNRRVRVLYFTEDRQLIVADREPRD